MNNTKKYLKYINHIYKIFVYNFLDKKFSIIFKIYHKIASSMHMFMNCGTQYFMEIYTYKGMYTLRLGRERGELV